MVDGSRFTLCVFCVMLYALTLLCLGFGLRVVRISSLFTSAADLMRSDPSICCASGYPFLVDRLEPIAFLVDRLEPIEYPEAQVGWLKRRDTRQEDVEGSPTQRRISPSIQQIIVLWLVVVFHVCC